MTLFLVVPCTKRKRKDTKAPLAFSHLPSLPPAELAQEWTDMAKRRGHSVPAQDLYCGAGWAASTCAYEAARRIGPAKLHVLSAGFGLIHPEEDLPLYNATFASEPDQVGRRVVLDGPTVLRHRAWWAAINMAQSRGSAPLTETCLDAQHVIITAGSDYLAAVQDDLIALQQTVGSDRLWIVGVAPTPELRPSTLSVTSRVEQILLGPRATLSQRVATWLLETIIPRTGWDRDQLQRAIQNVEQQYNPAAVVKRRPFSDDAVQDWIRATSPRFLKPSASGLLREFRIQGNACDADRFRNLFEAARATGLFTKVGG